MCLQGDLAGDFDDLLLKCYSVDLEFDMPQARTIQPGRTSRESTLAEYAAQH
jgi:hypothetical protein